MPASRPILGIAAGLIAGVPQVLATQAVARMVGLPEEHADIGPRFVDRLAKRQDRPLPGFMHWLLSALFHFAYAAGWGGLYGALQERIRIAPAPGGVGMAGIIYLLAFSRFGAATRTGSEQHPERREGREYVVHCTPALTFGLVMSFTYDWLDRRAHRAS